jgi:TRAP-type C4-dicarboxylate transport system permease small subunit
MALILIVNVTARFFNSSFHPAEELSQFLIFFITFLGTSFAARNGMHIRMSLLNDVLKGSLQKALALFVSLTTSMVMFYIAYLSILYVLKVAGQHRLSPILQWPVYYIYLIMPIGFFLTGLQYGLTFLRNVFSPGTWVSFAIQHENNLGFASGVEEDPTKSEV